MYKNVIVKRDLYNDKKYNMQFSGGGELERNKGFFKLLSRLDLWLGFTTNKEYNSAFFYVKEDFCSLRVFLKRIVDRCGYGSGYSEDGGSGGSGCGCISYDQAVFMSDSLCRQIHLFAGNGWGFYCFSLDNVYVVDNHKFIYLGIEHLVEIKGGEVRSGGVCGEKKIHFTVPFPEKMMIMRGGGGGVGGGGVGGGGGGGVASLFICPEIKNINRLPFSIMYSATYYHLASLIIYCMFHKNICFSEDDAVPLQTLSAINNTKLYWFLIRCLHNDPSKRILLWV
jgi:hypothetical protein